MCGGSNQDLLFKKVIFQVQDQVSKHITFPLRLNIKTRQVSASCTISQVAINLVSQNAVMVIKAVLYVFNLLCCNSSFCTRRRKNNCFQLLENILYLHYDNLYIVYRNGNRYMNVKFDGILVFRLIVRLLFISSRRKVNSVRPSSSHLQCQVASR